MVRTESELDLFSLLSEACRLKTTTYDVCINSAGRFGSHCFATNEFATLITQLVTLARRGKTALPLLAYDANLEFLLNKRKFFSSAVGYHFERQRGQAVNALLEGKPFTMLMTNNYGIEGNTTAPVRLWTATYRIINGTLLVTTVFGNVEILPALPYDFAAIEAMTWWYNKRLVLKQPPAFTWFFHALIGNGSTDMLKRPAPDAVTLGSVPLDHEVASVLAIEECIRVTRPGILPTPQSPLSADLTRVIEALHQYWLKRP